MYSDVRWAYTLRGLRYALTRTRAVCKGMRAPWVGPRCGFGAVLNRAMSARKRVGGCELGQMVDSLQFTWLFFFTSDEDVESRDEWLCWSDSGRESDLTFGYNISKRAQI